MKEILQERINELLIDKSNWKLTKFGEVAVQQKKSVNRENSSLTKYVKGEHMGSEDLHLRVWGELQDEYLGPAFIRYFEKDDILYGSRRTYLRKVVIAPFEGITSNTTFVIKANEKKIDKRLLPFIMMTDDFTEHSVRNSKGSVNPYINWKDISEYKFLLPSKEQQVKIAELLLAMDDVIEMEHIVKDKIELQDEIFKSSIILKGIKNNVKYSKFLRNNIAEGWKTTTIGALLNEGYIKNIQDGNHGETHPKSSDYVEDGIPFIMANTINLGQIDFLKSKKLPKNLTDQLRIGFSLPGDVLLSHKGTVGQVAIVPNELEYPYLMLTPQVTYYRTNQEYLNNKFLYYVFNSVYFQNQILKLSSQSTRAYIGITSQRNLRIAFPDDLNEQKKIVDILEKIENNKRLI
ncbi:hypothetical protein GON26_21335, partial [Flavobacterium sp. GA093]